MGMAVSHGRGEDDGAVPWLARGYGVSRLGMGGWPTRSGVRAEGEQRKTSRGLMVILCNFFLFFCWLFIKCSQIVNQGN